MKFLLGILGAACLQVSAADVHAHSHAQVYSHVAQAMRQNQVVTARALLLEVPEYAAETRVFQAWLALRSGDYEQARSFLFTQVRLRQRASNIFVSSLCRTRWSLSYYCGYGGGENNLALASDFFGWHCGLSAVVRNISHLIARSLCWM